MERAIKRFSIGQATAQEAISKFDLQNLRSEVNWDHFRDIALVTLTAYFAEGMPREIPAVHMPATWWQHLRMQLGFKYRMVELREAETVHTRACPHIPINGLGSHVSFLLGEDV